MPRQVPRYDRVLADKFSVAMSLVAALEALRIAPSGANAISLRDLEFAYEAAYLRIFITWEDFLEEVLLRFLCGQAHSGGPEKLRVAATYFGKIEDARKALLGGYDYLLWYDPTKAASRAGKFLAVSRYENVLLSAKSQLEHFAIIRHRIAHAQHHARIQFDNTTMLLAGKRYRASRPGRFLRDKVLVSGVPHRRLYDIADTLTKLAEQICT